MNHALGKTLIYNWKNNLIKQENHMLSLANKQYILDIAKLEESVSIHNVKKDELINRITELESHSVELHQQVDRLQLDLDAEKNLHIEKNINYENINKAYHEMEAVFLSEKKRMEDLEGEHQNRQNETDIELKNLYTTVKELEAELSNTMKQNEINRDEQENTVTNLRAEIMHTQNDATQKLHELEEKLLLSEESDALLFEIKQKTEKKIAKMKALSDKDISAMKAEMLLEVLSLVVI
uniref:Chromosome partition protein Smc n=1 Tax=Heterorhabditis bacteriophora TaxID=37862 RepID=A0A1I7XKH3_HETBA